jgi:hypothetical protein
LQGSAYEAAEEVAGLVEAAEDAKEEEVAPATEARWWSWSTATEVRRGGGAGPQRRRGSSAAAGV